MSAWTVAEFAGALGNKVREGSLTSGAARTVLQTFASFRASVRLLLPGASDFDLATRLVEDFATGLRAPDALHLAVARNSGVAGLVTVDRVLARAASLHGVRVVEPSP